jgi:predicted dehydrogenase
VVREKLRVGVIGVGRMGERHCRVYASLPDVEFVGVSDPAARRGSDVAQRYGVGFFPDFEDLLSEVDAVSIAASTSAHFQVAEACLDEGIHALIEKPLAATVDEAVVLVGRAASSSAVLQVGHIERFNPAFLELQSVLEGMEIVAINARRLSPFDTSNTEIDVVFDLMIHDVDLGLTLLGDDLQLEHAFGRAARTTAVDYATASLSVPHGAIATLTASRITEQKVRLLEITAVGAYVEADLLSKSISIYRRTFPEYVTNHERPTRYRQEGLVERIHIPSAEPLFLELQDFVRCARGQGQPRVSARDGLRALILAQHIREQVVAPVPAWGQAVAGRQETRT